MTIQSVGYSDGIGYPPFSRCFWEIIVQGCACIASGILEVWLRVCSAAIAASSCWDGEAPGEPDSRLECRCLRFARMVQHPRQIWGLSAPPIGNILEPTRMCPRFLSAGVPVSKSMTCRWTCLLLRTAGATISSWQQEPAHGRETDCLCMAASSKRSERDAPSGLQAPCHACLPCSPVTVHRAL